MLFIFASTLGSSALIAASPGIEGPGVVVPSIRPPDVPLRAIPVVDPLAAPVDPVEFAVPKLLVPGAVAAFRALPAPLGSLAELLRPPAFAGPFGTPLTDAVPAPAAPALGVPAALPLPTLGPLAAPAAEVPPPEAPPADPPPLDPPPLCANAIVPASDKAVANAITVVFMWHLCVRDKTTTRDNPSFQKNSRQLRRRNSCLGYLAELHMGGAERVRCRWIGCEARRPA